MESDFRSKLEKKAVTYSKKLRKEKILHAKQEVTKVIFTERNLQDTLEEVRMREERGGEEAEGISK